MRNQSENLVIEHCKELINRYGVSFEWNSIIEKNPHSVGGTFEWNQAHDKDPSKWTSIIVDRPETFPSLDIFVLVVCYELNKYLLYKRIANPENEEDVYWSISCDYAKGLYLWSEAIKMAKQEFDLEISMASGSYLNALIISGSVSENQFAWNQRDNK